MDLLNGFKEGFNETSILWLILSGLIGGVIGASVKLIFEMLIPSKILNRKEIIAKKRKYSTPILLVCDEMRKRCENMINMIRVIEAENWLAKERRKGYYYMSTLFTIAQFLGWRQILRREVVYLDFTSTKETRVFGRFMKCIMNALSSPVLLNDNSDGDPDRSPDKWVYTFLLHAIGDAMIVKEGEQLRIRSYHEFVKDICNSNDGMLSQWLDELGNIFIEIRCNEIRFRRIVALHSILNAFIEQMDPQHIRTREQKQYLDEFLEPNEKERIKQIINNIAKNKS